MFPSILAFEACWLEHVLEGTWLTISDKKIYSNPMLVVRAGVKISRAARLWEGIPRQKQLKHSEGASGRQNII